jgi:hypothetical protein
MEEIKPNTQRTRKQILAKIYREILELPLVDAKQAPERPVPPKAAEPPLAKPKKRRRRKAK